jgi:hypothetical protein
LINFKKAIHKFERSFQGLGKEIMREEEKVREREREEREGEREREREERRERI